MAMYGHAAVNWLRAGAEKACNEGAAGEMKGTREREKVSNCRKAILCAVLKVAGLSRSPI